MNDMLCAKSLQRLEAGLDNLTSKAKAHETYGLIFKQKTTS